MKKAVKKKKDWNKIFLITLLILLLLEIVLIPCLVYAEVKRILPIVAFLIVPTLFGIIILLLSRNCSVDYENKKNRLSKRI
jgi:membrane protein YdbS with pleckstrin-like domain